MELIAEGKTKQRTPNFEVPERELPCRFNVQPGTWFARDNVFNFILFCRKLGKVGVYFLREIKCSKLDMKVSMLEEWRNLFSLIFFSPSSNINLIILHWKISKPVTWLFAEFFYVKNHKAYPGAAAKLL